MIYCHSGENKRGIILLFVIIISRFIFAIIINLVFTFALFVNDMPSKIGLIGYETWVFDFY